MVFLNYFVRKWELSVIIKISSHFESTFNKELFTMKLWVIVKKESNVLALPFAFPSEKEARKYLLYGSTIRAEDFDKHTVIEIDSDAFEEMVHTYRLEYPN